jgi:hypothetical protein
MKANAGVWIDHRGAVIVTLTATGEHTARIFSEVEKHLERTGDSPLSGAYEAAQVPADDRRQRALTAKLNGYYDAVMEALDDAQSILIFGPGEAKGELKKRLALHRLDSRVAAMETADRMSDQQILTKVRDYFSEGRAGH